MILLAALCLASCATSSKAPGLLAWDPPASAPASLQRRTRQSPTQRTGPSAAKVRVKRQEERKQAHRLALLVGARSFDEDEIWDPIEDQLTIGFQYSTVGSSGFGVELGILGSTGFEDESGLMDDVTGLVFEAFGGLRKEFDWGRWRPSFGAGGAFVAAGIDNDTSGAIVDDQDTSVGVYAHGGLICDISPTTFLGVDYRVMTSTNIDFGTVRSDADYQQVTFVLGVRL